MNDYSKCIAFWDEVFRNESANIPFQKESGNKEFDECLAWLCEDSETLLDFGCGNGTVLFLGSFYGAKKHIGIDISNNAIESAKIRKSKMKQGQYFFYCGGIEKLKELDSGLADAAVLSNIIDNLYPEDAGYVLREIKRILKNSGKALIKLNPFLSEEQIEEYQIRVIKDNVLDDGLILWNNTTEKWTAIMSQYFEIVGYKEIYYEEHEQYNRIYLVKNNELNYEMT